MWITIAPFVTVLLRLAANEAPLPIKFTDKGNISVSDWHRCYPPGRELFNVRMTVGDAANLLI
ncbi:conserved hypothetical protein (plasmid) [Shigella boydii CDC 3083-94]|uniref:Uncharacterized protein n=1 Tax=Shigella boydii serotype 18 (strain CDC 3083-94 / BS512) TaxID=344609 RepID=B2TSP2_SHIB3|nr:conserved hypothetical protein [Shigella boydii CDC 3083-94]